MEAMERLAQKDVLSRLKADSALVAIVPAASIHPLIPFVAPTRPFVKLGPAQSLPRKAACLNGAQVLFGVHAFSRGAENGSGALTETAFDHAARIGARIKAALDDKGGTLSDGTSSGQVRYRIMDVSLMTDADDPIAAHWLCNVRATVTAE